MTRLLAALALVLLAAAPLRAAEVTGFTLDNGMEVVVLEDRRAPVVVHMVWYRVGAADEPPGKSGIAHFLEHLMFKSTDTLESGEFSGSWRRTAGTDNAFTSFDYTAYFQRVAADRLELMMEMEADRMVNLRLDPQEVATELQVILEERNQRTENEPGALFGEQRNAAQYMNHPYGIPVIGWRHEIEALTLEDAEGLLPRALRAQQRDPDRRRRREPEEVRAMAERHYGADPREPRSRRASARRAAAAGRTAAHLRRSRAWRSPMSSAPTSPPNATRATSARRRRSHAGRGPGRLRPDLGPRPQAPVRQQTAVYTSAFYSGTSLDDTTFGLVIVPPRA
jgi:zinc protease